MNKNGLLTAVGLGAAIGGIVLGATSKKVQAGVAAGKAIIINAWNGLVDRCRNCRKNEETPDNSEKEKENVEVVDAEEVDNFDPVE